VTIQIPQPETQALTPDSRPHLLRGVKLKNDQVRKNWVLLAPERYLRLNAISVDILQRCDGVACLAKIVDDLAAKYGADRALIERDVRSLLDGLLEKRMLGL
jgi:pyrroloquinoline quinone biosynthesis protein D